MSQNVPEKTILVSFVQGSKDVTPARYYRLVTTDGSAGIGFEGKIVDELPEEGNPHYIYLVKKASGIKGNIYDEWMWVLGQNDQYQWEKIGVTGEVSIELYGTEGQNTDGAMTQKAVSDALKELRDMISEAAGIGVFTDQEWEAFWK